MSTPHLVTRPIKDDYGGIEVVVGGLAYWLDKLGHEVHLFASEGSFEPPRGELHTVLKAADYSIPHQDYSTYFFNKLMDNDHHRKTLLDVDILNDHSLGHVGKQLKIHGLRNTYMLTSHDHIPDDNLIYEQLCRIALSNAQAKRLHDIAGTNWRVIYNGIFLTEDQYNPAEREDRLLFFSRMSYLKGPDRAVKIADAVEMPIDIVGGDRHPHFQYTVKLVKDLCAKSKYAHYVGEVDNKTKTEYFRNAKAVILPIRSDYFDPEHKVQMVWSEPGNLVPFDAGACGTPLICTPNGALAEYVEDGKTGFFAESLEDFVAAVKKLDTLDRSYIRKRIEERFSMERVAKDYVAMYQRIIDGDEW
jgi:glycosyltransferase involved in cell wall biosynthesis